jgi:peptidoglycan/LPS O-acetylase OafA/YrhL
MKVQPLSILGDYSFGIYFVHVAWIAVSTKLVHLIPEANMLPVYQFFQLVFVLFFSLASIFFERKILGPKLAEQVLGF